MKPLSIHSYPGAVVHFDGDAFFASCEQMLNPKLQGKPIVIGAERKIATSMSYEAKACGIKRGMNIGEIKRVCPEAIILPSDYVSYSLFAGRMYDIVRRYTPEVEEYSIDECFADITGMRRSLRMSYESIARAIKKDLEQSLGITFGAGLGPNKVIAKIASKWQKPAGFTAIRGKDIHLYLEKLPITKIWGIGYQTSAYLIKNGIHSALDLACKDPAWIQEKLTKPHQEIYWELRGKNILQLDSSIKETYHSISKTRTFSPPSKDAEFLFSQLSKNAEDACEKLRNHTLTTKRFTFFLKTQEFRYHSREVELSTQTSATIHIIKNIRECLHTIYKKDVLYRATGITLHSLKAPGNSTLDLFGNMLQAEEAKPLYNAIDSINKKYGQRSLFLGSSARAMKHSQVSRKRDGTAIRSILPHGNPKKYFEIPILGKVK